MNEITKDGVNKVIADLLAGGIRQNEFVFLMGGMREGGKSYYNSTLQPENFSNWGVVENTHTPAKFYTATSVVVDKNSLIYKLVRKL